MHAVCVNFAEQMKGNLVSVPPDRRSLVRSRVQEVFSRELPSYTSEAWRFEVSTKDARDLVHPCKTLENVGCTVSWTHTCSRNSPLEILKVQ
jgi:hypothetical protein